MTTWLLLIACVGMTYAYWRANRAMLSAQYRLARALEESTAQADAIGSYRQVLLKQAGGLGKRISECREITSELLHHNPELFSKEQGLVYWLDATDQFLCALHAVYCRHEGADPVMEHCASARSDTIYQRVYDATGLPPPP